MIDTDSESLVPESALTEEAGAIACTHGRTPSNGADRPGVCANAALEHRVAEVLEDVEELLGHPVVPADGKQGLEATEKRARGTIALIRRSLERGSPHGSSPQAGRLAACAIELQELCDELRDPQLELRFEALEDIANVLRRLEGLESTAQVVKAGARELSRMRRFDRAIFFRVEGQELVAESVQFGDEQDWAGTLLEFAGRARPQLDQGIPEGRSLRRRRPVLVEDPQHDPTSHRPLVVATDTRAYVAAPIVSDGRPIAFLHGDRYFARGSVGEFDREVLSVFAAGFGHAVARTATLDRVRSNRGRLRQALASAEAAMNQVCDARIALANSMTEPEASPPPSYDRSARLLTRRQRQIIELMSEGATNADIANRLVLSPDTVKSHVRQILRVMQAANRAEAVSRYVRLVSAGSGPRPLRR
jgi:LuxR family transcriptional regulator, regulator of acetate metabolism